LGGKGDYKMKKTLKVTLFSVLFLIVLYLTFIAGRYSFLITKPEFLLNKRERLFVEKARQYAKEQGIPEEHLVKPRVVDTKLILFGGQAGLGGVEVLIDDRDAEILQISSSVFTE